ncbi:MAG TPA: NAD(P)-dependent oxidoreductase [Candidatus Didemnitutus sp.]|nr:NAD(P)-dependent oxidoreductase [Candidatus Didemnitutus sp.]
MSPATGADAFIPRSARVLVTGSNGFIGARLVDQLLADGYRQLRCFVRPSSKLDRLREVCRQHGVEGKVEIVAGDLLSRADCERAAEGVTLVHHLAAGFDKSFAGAFMNTALATRNLVEAALAKGTLKRFVNISSFAVYSNRELAWGGTLDETCALEDSPVERNDAYCFGKLKQDELVERYGRERGLPFVTLRPGTVFGPGKQGLSGRVGIDTFGTFIQIGGSNIVPLTFVDNCAEAIFLAGITPGIDGETFNVVDDEEVTAREFLNAYRRHVRSFRVVRVPYFVAYGMCALWEKYSRWSQGQLPPAFNRRRCRAEWKRTRFSNRRIRSRLGWQPRVSVRAAFAAMAAARNS